jgi:hypothetical protein
VTTWLAVKAQRPGVEALGMVKSRETGHTVVETMVETVVETVVDATVAIGARTEIRNIHLQKWSRGFQVAAIIADGYLVRRLADNFILPRAFAADDIRAY